MFCQSVQCLSCVNAMMDEPVLRKQDVCRAEYVWTARGRKYT